MTKVTFILYLWMRNANVNGATKEDSHGTFTQNYVPAVVHTYVYGGHHCKQKLSSLSLFWLNEAHARKNLIRAAVWMFF